MSSGETDTANYPTLEVRDPTVSSSNDVVQEDVDALDGKVTRMEGQLDQLLKQMMQLTSGMQTIHQALGEPKKGAGDGAAPASRNEEYGMGFENPLLSQNPIH